MSNVGLVEKLWIAYHNNGQPVLGPLMNDILAALHESNTLRAERDDLVRRLGAQPADDGEKLTGSMLTARGWKDESSAGQTCYANGRVCLVAGAGLWFVFIGTFEMPATVETLRQFLALEVYLGIGLPAPTKEG